jgi:hypothetical protein
MYNGMIIPDNFRFSVCFLQVVHLHMGGLLCEVVLDCVHIVETSWGKASVQSTIAKSYPPDPGSRHRLRSPHVSLGGMVASFASNTSVTCSLLWDSSEMFRMIPFDSYGHTSSVCFPKLLDGWTL